ncbi:hypothetical protein FRC02_010809 [Tulasnella sp. 418]|nr:hypothetical protein FRC02_010809 [Tulasnella sp. 418]
MEDIEMPIEQLRILSVQLIHLRLRIHRQESENFLPLRDLLESCPNIQALSLTAGTDELGYFPDLSSISPITFHHLRTLHLMQFGVWATLQLLISIRSPVLTMIEAEADLARGRHRGIKDLSWISEKTATDSALSIFLSQFDKLSFESDYQSVYFCVGSSKTQQWKTLGVNDNTAALLEVLHNYMDVSNVRLGGRDTLSHMPRILDCFGSLQRLTLVHATPGAYLSFNG